MRRVLLTAAAAGLLCTSSAALAGAFADGYGETIPQAMDAALNAAEKAVASRGSGCIKPYNGEIFHDLQKKTISGVEVWYVKAHYAKHAGSCGQYSRDEKWLREQAGRLFGG